MNTVSMTGLDIQSIVTSSVNLKTQQMNSPIQTKIQSYNNSLSGLGKLSSLLSSFSDSMKKGDEFDVQKNLASKSGKNDLYAADVKTNKDASEDEYNIEVVQTHKKAKITSRFSRDFSNNFRSGTINFDLGDDKKFSVEVQAGESLAQIRKNINDNNPFGVSATLVNSTSGYVLTLNSDFDFDISFGGDLSEDFGDLEKQQSQQAIIRVNGEEMRSDTNTFTGIEGLEITANFEGNLQAKVQKNSTNKEAIDNFVKNFNALMDNIDALGKRSTITDGVSNNDGGLLAGNSSLRLIKDKLKNSIDFEGLEFDRYGKLQYKGDYETDITEQFDKTKEVIDEFLSKDSIISKEKDMVNDALKDANERIQRNNTYIQKYQDAITKKYSKLDELIQNTNARIQMINDMLS